MLRIRVGSALLVLVAGAALVGCAGAPPPEPDGSESVAPSTPDFAGSVDLGNGRSIYLECKGTGEPRVVFIGGQRAGAGDWQVVADGQTVAPVFEQVAAQTRACVYDRPGTVSGDVLSRSDAAPQPTTTGAMVDDLHLLLEASGETGPTIIVAHSVGGLAGVMYSGLYPDDIVGLVLVDALNIYLQDAETPEQWEIQKSLLAGDLTEAIAEYPEIERLDADPSFDLVRAAPKPQQMPYVILTSDEIWGPIVEQQVADGLFPPEVPADFGYVLDAAQLQSRANLAALIPGGEWIKETHSGHNIHIEQPQLVSDVILGMIDRVRTG